MDSHNLNVLVEAKEQYLGQLCDIMMPFMNEVFAAMYNESVKASKGKKVLIQFQKFLKEVPNWNNHMVTQHTDKLCSSCGWFNDLLAAVFVSFVKILSSVRKTRKFPSSCHPIRSLSTAATSMRPKTFTKTRTCIKTK